jgi:hypothetical protein
MRSRAVAMCVWPPSLQKAGKLYVDLSLISFDIWFYQVLNCTGIEGQCRYFATSLAETMLVSLSANSTYPLLAFFFFFVLLFFSTWHLQQLRFLLKPALLLILRGASPWYYSCNSELPTAAARLTALDARGFERKECGVSCGQSGCYSCCIKGWNCLGNGMSSIWMLKKMTAA